MLQKTYHYGIMLNCIQKFKKLNALDIYGNFRKIVATFVCGPLNRDDIIFEWAKYQIAEGSAQSKIIISFLIS